MQYPVKPQFLNRTQYSLLERIGLTQVHFLFATRMVQPKVQTSKRTSGCELSKTKKEKNTHKPVHPDLLLLRGGGGGGPGEEGVKINNLLENRWVSLVHGWHNNQSELVEPI